MESSKYYGLGSDEYNIYKTLNNGETWMEMGKSHGPVQAAKDGRIIIYSNENQGLKYSDDGLITIIDSNIIDGNFKNIPVPKKDGTNIPVTDNIYALSLDGNGIYETLDNGESWRFFSGGTGDTMSVSPKDGKIYIHGNGDLIELPTEKNGLPRFYPNSVFSPEGPIAAADVITEESKKNLGTGLIYILNEIIIPKLTSMLTGHEDLNYFNSNNSPDIGAKYFTDGEVYKVKKDGIDWAGDVGMMPLSEADFPELVKAKEETGEYVSSYRYNTKKLEEELKDTNSNIYRTFDIINDMLDARREERKSTILGAIRDEPEDYSDLKTAEGKSAMKMMYEVQKGALQSISGTILNAIFLFDDSKRLSLLRASIIETANSMKCSIQSVLSSMYQDVINGRITKEEMREDDYYKELLTFDKLERAWLSGLEESINIYYNQCRDNIETLSSDKDKKYIAIAADKYKEVREDLLDVAVDCAKKIEIQLPSQEENVLYQLGDDLDSAVNQVTAAAVEYLAIAVADRDRAALDKKLDEVFAAYLEKENEVFNKKGTKEEEKKENDIFNVASLEDAIREGFRSNINKYLTFTNPKINDKFYFDELDYEDDLKHLTLQEQEKVKKYYNDIIAKFRERCLTLMEIVTTEQSNDLFNEGARMSGDLSIYISRLKNNIDKEGFNYDVFYKDNSIEYLHEEAGNVYEDHKALSIKSWIAVREKI